MRAEKIDRIYTEITHAVDTEIHQLFESILTTRKLGRKSRTDILNLYHSLQFMGLLSPKLDNESERDSIFEDFDPDSVPGPPGDDFPPHRHNAHQEEPNSAEAFSPEPPPPLNFSVLFFPQNLLHLLV